MSPMGLGQSGDLRFPDYAYIAAPLASAFDCAGPGKRKKVATLFIGEWAKILDKPVPQTGPVHVKFRGGEGYVDANDLGRQRLLEIYFIDVDQGDSILIQTPDDRRVLIDGGKTADAFDFIINKYRLDKQDNFIDFEAVVATHSDADHTQGLVKIIKHPKIAVKRFYHNGLFRRQEPGPDPGPVVNGRVYGLVDNPGLPGNPKLTPLMKKIVEAARTAKKNLPGVVKKMNALPRWQGGIQLPPEGFVFKRLEAADQFLPPFDDGQGNFSINVLWPRANLVGGRLSYPSYGKVDKTVNGNSIVLGVRCGQFKIILAGDLNASSMGDILKTYPGDPASAGVNAVLVADVYKAAHHGSQDFSIDFLKAVQPNAAVISSGDDRNDIHGHPRAVLMGTITRYSRTDKPAVFSTELAACFTPLSPAEQKKFRAGTAQLYERSIKGIVHLRSDGTHLYLGTVHGRKQIDGKRTVTDWKWDIWP